MKKRFHVYKKCLRLDLCKYITDVKILEDSIRYTQIYKTSFTNTLAMRKCTQFFTAKLRIKKQVRSPEYLLLPHPRINKWKLFIPNI